MNRTFRLSKQAYTLPLRPLPSTLPTNLRCGPQALSLVSRCSTPARSATKVGQYLRPGVGVSFVRFNSTSSTTNKDKEDKAHPGQKGPDPGSSPKDVKPNREDQNATPGAGDELRGMTRDFAKIISGGSPQAAALGAREISAHGHGGSIAEDFYSITKGMITEVPKPVLVTGLAGTIPYLGTSASIVLLAREASLASQAGGESPAGLDLPTALSYLHNLEHIQITYGAIILSFLGALHWGMEFAKLGGEQGYRRLAVGIFPVLFAWPTLLASHGVALAAQWFGFTWMWFLDQKATGQGWTTSWYSTYRFYLSIIVGFSIIGTLVGTSYYGAGAGAITDAGSPHLRHTTERISALKRLDKVKEKNYPSSANTKVGIVEGKVAGDVQVDKEESGESYLKLRNTKREQEEKEAAEKKEQEEKQKKEEEEKKAKAQEQDKKEQGQKERSPDGMKDDSKSRAGGESGSAKKGDDDKQQKQDQDQKKGDNDNQGGDKKDDKQAAAAEDKGAAGDKNTAMK
ncbi:hypothetical protein I316_05653 [Kwoniella heveanensis BCC8398]|uniref:Mitochondrial inner membrane protein 1 n=1 Tax=Kwoniella heveanensis BCC8398 TaxID=1296120 RepID=A0A1B9GNU5_9TREE|nr:hypothetical protein I316_05653 [Kwoniella heveanensis BCC8398]